MPNEPQKAGDAVRAIVGDEQLARQVEAVRADISKLASRVAELASDRARSMSTEVAQGVGHAAGVASRTGRELRDDLETTVAAHPMMAVGVAAGIGYLVGMISRR